MTLQDIFATGLNQERFFSWRLTLNDITFKFFPTTFYLACTEAAVWPTDPLGPGGGDLAAPDGLAARPTPAAHVVVTVSMAGEAASEPQFWCKKQCFKHFEEHSHCLMHFLA